MPARREVGSFSGCGSRGGRPSLDAGVCDAQDAGIVHTGKEEYGHATIRSDTGGRHIGCLAAETGAMEVLGPPLAESER